MPKLRCGGFTTKGNYRENNEDSYSVDEDRRFFIVADGMGGQSAGETASKMATDLVSRELVKHVDFDSAPPDKVQSCVNQAIKYANSQIMDLGEQDPSFHNMGTTITLVLSVGDQLYAAGVGDSRIYLLRGGKLQQLTTDHSLSQALLDAGTISEEEAETHRYRNVLYRYLGTQEGSSEVDLLEIGPQPDDRVILCSDGVTDGIDDDALNRLLAEHDDPEQAAEAIVNAAEAGGSKDNITCVVVHVESP